jgi:hypothetical protein
MFAPFGSADDLQKIVQFSGQVAGTQGVIDLLKMYVASNDHAETIRIVSLLKLFCRLSGMVLQNGFSHSVERSPLELRPSSQAKHLNSG